MQQVNELLLRIVSEFLLLMAFANMYVDDKEIQRAV